MERDRKPTVESAQQERAPRGRRWTDPRMAVLVLTSAAAVATLVALGPEEPEPDWSPKPLSAAEARVVRSLLGTEGTDKDAPGELEEGVAAASPTAASPDGSVAQREPAKTPSRYGVEGPGDEPTVASDRARTAGALGVLERMTGAYNAPTSPFGGDSTTGNDPVSALGALMGDEIGDSFGYGGLGLRGTGRGGGTVGSSAGAMMPLEAEPFAREGYEHIDDTGFQLVGEHPLSTFSIDVDTASYANVRRFLVDGSLPPPDAVRVEELVNYFDYDYPAPRGAEPFAVHTELGACPWNPAHRLLHVGIQGRRIDQSRVPARNLVFLLDVSGSMESPDKLPLLVSAINLLVDQLRSEDRVAIVVYAGAAGLVLPSTAGSRRSEIRRALGRLRAGGSTNGGDGIHLAYRLARAHFIPGGINRVILATDGDFNVGTTSNGELTRLIETTRATGVFLTVLGFGTGNLQDHTMETLADNGNGSYAYIDSIAEARRVLVREAGATLVTIAKDVKLQLEFNPARVASYRLIGYENRRLRDEEFNDDTRDAGEIGAGHTVTALYELVPAGSAEPTAAPAIDPLRYQGARAPSAVAASEELATVKVRYKRPDGETSILLSRTVREPGASAGAGSDDYRFSAAVAAFGMLLRGAEDRGDATVASVRALAQGAVGTDRHGDRRELLRLMDRAAGLGLSAR